MRVIVCALTSHFGFIMDTHNEASAALWVALDWVVGGDQGSIEKGDGTPLLSLPKVIFFF